jgi:NhaA family Na+:H+ antiporter
VRRLSVQQPALLLLPAALCAIILAQVSARFVNFLQQPFLSLSLTEWVADLLLAIFFFIAGAELKSEFDNDRSAAHILTPLLGALGGMALPALSYLLFAQLFNAPTSAWGVPMATDLPIALALVALSQRINIGTRMFLLALAIFDDIGSILIIALRFTHEFSLIWAGLALLGACTFYMTARRGFSSPILFLIGVTVWYCVFKGGIHPTVAGALLGALLPSHRLKRAISFWTPVTNYVVLPLFIFTALAIPLSFSWQSLRNPIVISLILARMIGKPLGIMFGILIAQKIFRMKKSLSLSDYWLVSILGTVGFSVSLLFTELSLTGSEKSAAVLGVLLTLPCAIGLSLYTLKRR